jgi:hypothetical protein
MDPMTILGLVSAGGSLLKGIGSLFGNRGQSWKRNQPGYGAPLEPIHYRQLAERGGFNPLTVLRAASGGAFANPGYQPMPTLSSLEVIGDSLGGVASALSFLDPIARETEQARLDLLKEEIQERRDERETRRNQAMVQRQDAVGRPLSFDAVPRVSEATTSDERHLTVRPGILGSPSPRRDWVTLQTADGRTYSAPDPTTAMGVEEYIPWLFNQAYSWARRSGDLRGSFPMPTSGNLFNQRATEEERREARRMVDAARDAYREKGLFGALFE